MLVHDCTRYRKRSREYSRQRLPCAKADFSRRLIVTHPVADRVQLRKGPRAIHSTGASAVAQPEVRLLRAEPLEADLRKASPRPRDRAIQLAQLFIGRDQDHRLRSLP